MKIAKFKEIKHEYESIWEQPMWRPESERDSYQPEGYVRITEWVEVELPPLKGDDVIQVQLEAIDKLEQTTRIKFQEELDRIKELRAQLLALPAPAETE